MKNQESTIKRRSAVLAGLLVLVMLLTGTLPCFLFGGTEQYL